MQNADVAGFRAQGPGGEGSKRGLGYSCYIEACGIAPSNIAGALGARAARSRPARCAYPTGTVTVFTGSHSHARATRPRSRRWWPAKLGIPVRTSRSCTATPAACPSAWAPTAAARSVGGTAIVKASTRSSPKGKKIAAHLLEAGDTDIEFEGRQFKVAGTDKVPFGSAALTAYCRHNYPLDINAQEPGP